MPTTSEPSSSLTVEPTPRLGTRLRTGLVAAAGLFAFAGGLVTLIGWGSNRPRLTDWFDVGISMLPNAALCACISGVGLLLLLRCESDTRRCTGVRILAVLVALVGGLTLFQHLSGVSLGIDRLLFDRPWGQRAVARPMRMGPPGSTSYLFIGLSLLLTTYRGRARWFASALATVPVAIASFSLIGYWFGADQLYTLVNLTAISLQTSTMIAALGVGLLAAVPEHGIAALLGRNDGGGMMVRRLLLAIIVVPLLISWIRLRGEDAGFYDTAFGVSMTALATIAMLLALLAWTAVSVSRAAETTKVARDELEAVLKKDLEERREAEKKLREREHRYELVVAGAEAAIWDWDLVDKRVLYSPRWKQLRGLAEHEVGDGEDEWKKGIHPEDYERVMNALRRHVEGRTPFFSEEYRIRHKDGHWIWILDRGIAMRDESGQAIRMAGSETDITERKRAEEELRQAEERMRSVVDHVVDGIITIDEAGRIESFNSAAEKLFGYLQKEVIGQNVKILMPEPYQGQHDRYLQNFLTTGEAKIIGIGREVVGKRKDSSTFPMELAVSTFRIDSRTYFTGIVRDITERKRLEDELRQRVEELAEADRRKNEFLATLAHELRNPLAPIRNSLQLLKMSESDDLPETELQEIMQRQVDYLVRLVDDLLEVSRINNGKIDLRPERMEITQVLRSAVETSSPLVEKNKHQLSVTYPDEPLEINGDPVRLAQVVANLLNNAAKYTEPGGNIYLSAAREGGDVAISVRDTGIGISAEMQPALFQMFSQVDKDHKLAQGGLGIGLALAKSLIELHGGRIEAKSEGRGHGSQFTVRLPLAGRHAPAMNGTETNLLEKQAAAGIRALVVDDNRDAATSLSILLRTMGNEVQTASDGPAALEAIETFKPHVVFLDLGMPGMSGFEVASQARAKPAGQHCVLIALTGWGQEEDRQRSSEAGFNHHLLKPVSIEQIEAVLSEVQQQCRSSDDATAAQQ